MKKNLYGRVLSLLTSIILLFTVIPTAMAENGEKLGPTTNYVLKYKDVNEGNWAATSIQFVVFEKLIYPVTDDYFIPEGYVTRGNIVEILHRLDKDETVYENPFSDVEDDAYYANAIGWAFANGIAHGYSATEFAPDELITRQDMATFLSNYIAYKNYDIDISEYININSYDDYGDISEYAVPAMKWACTRGIIRGYDGKLRPKDLIRRDETAKVIETFTIKIKNH